MSYDWDFSALAPYIPALGRGVLITIALAVGSSVVGTIAGVPLAAGLRVKAAFMTVPLGLAVDVLRAIPNLVLIFLFYYFPYRQILGVDPPSAFYSALLALIAAQAAYSADLFRAAVDQVPEDQVLGLKALGFSKHLVRRHAVVPSVTRQVLPSHVALWIGNLKLSSLASVIGVTDLVYVAKVAMAQSFRSLEAWIVVAAIYVALVLPAAYFLRKLERLDWMSRQ